MCLLKAASVVSFFGALVIGVAAAWALSPWGSYQPSADMVLPAPIVQGPMMSGHLCHRGTHLVKVTAEDLRGRWRGDWGGDPSLMDIDLIEGNRFYGKLSDGEAEIRIEGTVDTEARRVTIRETKVLRLDPDVEWSLGKDIGSFSADGRTLSGSGTDKWQSYEWEMEKQ